MQAVFRQIDLGGGSIAKCLVRPSCVVFELPKFQPIFSFFRTDEPLPMEELFVVGAIASLDNAVLPGTARADGSMQQVQLQDRPFKGAFSFRMSAEFHREFQGIVGPDEKKGGSKSKARWSTPATVEEERFS